MEIDLGSEIQFNVKCGSRSWVLREPTFKDVKDFRDASTEDNQETAFLDFLSKLGMPKDDAESLGVLKLKKLTEYLISNFDEKK